MYNEFLGKKKRKVKFFYILYEMKRYFYQHKLLTTPNEYRAVHETEEFSSWIYVTKLKVGATSCTTRKISPN